MPVWNEPSFAVAECGVGPLLFQVTVSPVLTVIVAGVKLKSAIVTEPLAAAIAFGLAAARFSARSSARNCGSGGAGAASAGAGAGCAGAGAGSAGAGAGSAGAC